MGILALIYIFYVIPIIGIGMQSKLMGMNFCWMWPEALIPFFNIFIFIERFDQ